MKTCSKCKINKADSEFQKNAQQRSGLAPACKECHRQHYISKRQYPFPYRRNGRIRETTELTAFESHLKRRYGIDLDQYNKIVADQAYCCAVCRTHQDKLIRRLAVDHNHITGQVRGALCWGCNAAIGHLRTDEGTQLLEAAVAYIKTFAQEPQNKIVDLVKKEG